LPAVWAEAATASSPHDPTTASSRFALATLERIVRSG
jgi:hypothetical protein